MEQSTPGEEHRQVLEDIEHMFEEFDKVDAEYGKYDTLLGSDFASDNDQIPEWRLSNLVPSLLGTAVDHVHSLRLSSGAPPIGRAHWNARAPWTLLRAAFESASQAIWMACPDDQDERIKRYLCFCYDDRCNQFKAERHTYRPRDQDKVHSLEDWDDAEFKVKAARWDTPAVAAWIRRTPNFSDCVKEAAEHVRAVNPEMAVLYWRVASAYAHGRPWGPKVAGQVRNIDDGSGLTESAIGFDQIARMIGITTLTIQYCNWLIKKRMGYAHAEYKPFMTIAGRPYNKIASLTK
ncbi:hypothetical protein [Nakamurella sp.]|uniref:hypothetical protein n=1 Tax=Nakamurella sp. TaxID=1869182 RepID=UPI003B3B431C